MKDPFEEFLEDAMSGPDDLDLGHEARRRLLEAAVAGEVIPANNVVRMDRAEPHEREGFDWIVGEIPATEPLMSRLIEDPRFLAELDGSRCFLRTLRAALLKQAEVAVPAARRRFMPAVAIAAAAAVALAAGTIFFNPPGKSTATVVAQNAAPGKSETSVPPSAAASLPTAAPVEPAQEVAAVDVATEPVPDFPAPAPAILPPGAITPELDEAPAIAALAGSGQSIEGADPLLAEAGGNSFTLKALAVNPAYEESASLSLDEGGSEPALASLSRDGSLWSESGFMAGLSGGSGRLNTSLINDGKESSIPEPGVAAPVLIGMMVLLLRRKRPGRESQG